LWRAAIGFWRNAPQLGGAAFLTDGGGERQPWPDRAHEPRRPRVGPGAGTAYDQSWNLATQTEGRVWARSGRKADDASKEKPAAVRRRAVVRALWGVGGARGRILAGGSILSITS